MSRIAKRAMAAQAQKEREREPAKQGNKRKLDGGREDERKGLIKGNETHSTNSGSATVRVAMKPPEGERATPANCARQLLRRQQQASERKQCISKNRTG